MPFFISHNATPRSGCSSRTIDFKHVSKPEDILKVEKKRVSPLAKIRGEADDENDYFPLIQGQFAAFCETVFGKSLDSL